MSSRDFKKSMVVLAVAVTAMLYTNCGRVSPSNFLVASSLGLDRCSGKLKKVYEQTYYTFLSNSNNCNSCHQHSNSFGSKDLNTSFNSFLSRSLSTIDYKAVTAHGGNSNSAANQPVIDSFKTQYRAGYSEYVACKATEDLTAVTADILLVSKKLPTLADHNNQANSGWVTMTWQVETEAREAALGQLLKASISIQVRRYKSGTLNMGLQFRNPMLTLATGQSPIHIEALKIFVNDQEASDVTSYEYLNLLVSDTTPTAMAPSSGAPSYVGTFDTTTDIALELAGVGEPPPPPLVDMPPPPVAPEPVATPTPVQVVLPTRVTYAELVANTGAYNVFFKNNCLNCHSAAGMAGGLNLESYPAAMAAAAKIKLRVNDAVAPMPTAGLMSQFERDLVGIWVDGGAPQN